MAQRGRPRSEGPPIDAGIVARVSGAVRGFVAGITGRTFFGPGQPQEVQVDPALEPERVFQYPPAFNLRAAPTRESGVSFAQLRQLADAYDLLRLAIETRKDQLGRLSWEIRTRQDRATSDPRIPAIKDRLLYPDNEHSWSTWLRMLCEEMFVLDAVVLHPRWTKGGDLYGIELIDGSTIKRVIDKAGRTPPPLSVAYQQVIHGIVVANFSRDQLLYFSRNKRVHRVYGYSHVEQILTLVNIALRRQKLVLDYYTEGNVPDSLCGTPEEWTVDQIKQFQEYWDYLMQVEDGARRKVKFVPGAIAQNYKPTREPELTGEFDEWLARVVCYTFSLPPTAFIRQMNRATAESSQVSSLEEGLEPTKKFVESVMGLVLAKCFDAPDLEFVFRYEASLDRLKQAKIHETYVKSGIISPNEARAEIGLGPREGGDLYAEEVKAEELEAQAKARAATSGTPRAKTPIRSNAADGANSTD